MEGLNAALKGMETPPRTWRRRTTPPRFVVEFGNTSTDVEKTADRPPSELWSRKHLHGRGEDNRDCLELVVAFRNTSTDVEKTGRIDRRSREGEKHLHGRGEDMINACMSSVVVETPPRTWRRRPLPRLRAARGRNTSTDVEKTCFGF